MPLFDIKLKQTPLSSALTEVVVTANGFDEVVSKFSSVALGGLSFGIALLSKASYISHDSFPKTVHFFTKAGLKTVSYQLGDLQNSYPRFGRSSYATDNFDRPPYTIVSELERDFPMSFAAQATSAAPTFFPPVQLHRQRLMDGGILQNNPAIPCILEFLNKVYARENLFMVSLGTGEVSNLSRNSFDLASSVLSKWFHITQPDLGTENTLRGILSRGAYHRFQYRFDQTPPGLDDIRPETITLLEEAGRELVEKNEDKIRDVCKILKPESL